MQQHGKSVDRYALYYFTTCPYCIKVRLAMWLKGIRIPLKNIQSNGEFRAELIKGGGKVQVPCLRIENEQGAVNWMYESDDIIRYLTSSSA